MFVSSHCFTHLSPPLSFPLTLLPSPLPYFCEPSLSVQGASGLDGRPGPPVSSISLLPYIRLPQYRDSFCVFHLNLVYTRNNLIFAKAGLGGG